MTIDFTTWKGITDGQTYGIPDNQVYLHDDFGGGEPPDREDSAEFEYEEETAFYRPDWTVEQGSVSGWDGSVTIDDEDTVIGHPINLDLSQTVRWFWEVSNVDGRFSTGLFYETESVSENSLTSYSDGYLVRNFGDNDTFGIVEIGPNGETTSVADADSEGIDSGFYGVERDSSGEWELFVTTDDLDDPRDELFISDNSVATASNTEYTDPQVIDIGETDGSGSVVEEMKVF